VGLGCTVKSVSVLFTPDESKFAFAVLQLMSSLN